MEYGSSDLRKLAKKKRSRVNLETVQSALSDMESTKSEIESWLEQVQEVRGAIDGLLDYQENMDADLLGPAGFEAIAQAAVAMEKVLPEEDSIAAGFVEYHGNASESCDSLESMLEDREYGAEDRDQAWDEITDNLVNMADALDELSSLGDKKDAASEDE